MNGYDLLLRNLSKVNKAPLRNGQVRAHRALCPVCERSNRSLSLAESSDGSVLINCFGGCEASAIVERVGMTLADLFPPDRSFKAGAGHKGPRIWAGIPTLIDDVINAHVRAYSRQDIKAAAQVHDSLLRLRDAIYEAMNKERALRERLKPSPAPASNRKKSHA